MPLDFRYHLASLAAVFGALLIGVLLGVAMNEGPGLHNQIQDLREEFRRAQALRDIDQHTNDFNLRTQHLMTANRLPGWNIALVQGPRTYSEEELEAIRRVFTDAGAEITTELSLKPALMDLTPVQLGMLYRKYGLDTKDASVSDLVGRLALELGRPSTPLLTLLQQEKLVKLQSDPRRSFSTIIYLGGVPPAPKDTVSVIDVSFLEAITQRAVRIAAVEPFEAETSAIPEYKRIVRLTVDNIDRAAGRTTLILALASNHLGHFGYKKTADDVAPDVE